MNQSQKVFTIFSRATKGTLTWLTSERIVADSKEDAVKKFRYHEKENEITSVMGPHD